MVNPIRKGTKLNKPKRERSASVVDDHDPSASHSSLLIEVLEVIESYFEPSRLENDCWLQSHMDGEGFVPLVLLATFDKVKQLGVDNNILEEAVSLSELLEHVQKPGSGHSFIRVRPSNVGDLDDLDEAYCDLTGMSIDSEAHTFSPRKMPILHEIQMHSPYVNDLIASSLPTYYSEPSSSDWQAPRRTSIIATVPETPSNEGDDDQFEMEDEKLGEEAVKHVPRPRSYSETDTKTQSIYADDIQDDIPDFGDEIPEISRLVVVTPKKKREKMGQNRRHHKLSDPHFRAGAKKEILQDIQSQLYYYFEEDSNKIEETKEPETIPEDLNKVVSPIVPDTKTPEKPVIQRQEESEEQPSSRQSYTDMRRASVSSVSSHVSHQLLEEYDEVKFIKFRGDALKERQRLGPGMSRQMNNFFRFYCYYLRTHFNFKMYNDFKALAVRDFHAGYNYGLQCLFRMMSFGLEKFFFSQEVLKDFMDLVELDYYKGKSLYGLEKFVALLEYRSWKEIEVKYTPRLAGLLRQYPTLASFPAVQKKRADKNKSMDSDYPKLGSVPS
ncbi:hypothetical protein RCL1_005297 [Eukaryota sp. TZLM3-RCL]